MIGSAQEHLCIVLMHFWNLFRRCVMFKMYMAVVVLIASQIVSAVTVQAQEKSVPVVGGATARRELTWRQRAELGLTPGKLAQRLKTLRDSGEIDAQSSDGEIAAALTASIHKDHPKAKVDWDAILAFIEKLIPLILQIIELFSYNVPADIYGGIDASVGPSLCIDASVGPSLCIVA